jgi:hypothetical protein
METEALAGLQPDGPHPQLVGLDRSALPTQPFGVRFRL